MRLNKRALNGIILGSIMLGALLLICAIIVHTQAVNIMRVSRISRLAQSLCPIPDKKEDDSNKPKILSKPGEGIFNLRVNDIFSIVRAPRMGTVEGQSALPLMVALHSEGHLDLDWIHRQQCLNGLAYIEGFLWVSGLSFFSVSMLKLHAVVRVWRWFVVKINDSVEEVD